MTTIKLLAHLLQRNDVVEEEKLDYSRTIAVECDRQIDFVGNLLDLSRIESRAYKLRQTRVDVRELIDSCVSVERHRAESLGLTLITDIPLDPGAIKGDSEALRRVIRELIGNALKYTPAGGRITVSARLSDETISITVNDTGKGIAETDLPHVFDKFYRANSDGVANQSGTAAPGVGLGLYLAEHIVVQLDGEIRAESRQGVGTTFSVRLPRWIDAVAEESEENEIKALAGD